ncbi:MAG: DEAD/DEAH box helicase, partial [Candidatus Acidiferrales bacterium]
MPLFCDVALAVPLDMVFTYAIPPGMEPVVGGRVLVPFRQHRLSGVVVELHDRPPQVKTKKVIEALDLSPVLDEHLLKLGKWIADYYLAPVGEVFRTMLPLSAEFKRSVAYRITDAGRMALHLAGMSGSPARSKRTPEQQLVEFRVLDYLAERESARAERLRGATRVGKALLAGMVRKRWIAREDVSAARDAARVVKVAVLLGVESGAPLTRELDGGTPGVLARQDGRDARLSTSAAKKLNGNQRALIETLAASGGRLPVEALRGLDVPRTTLGTLVRRGLIELVNEPLDFTASGVKLSTLKPRRSPFEFEFSAAQKEALAKIGDAVAARRFGGLLLHGITGSGKTAVYLACMREVLEQGRSSILLVPEIGLTPAVAADLHQVFGDEVAILHSGLSDAERAEQWHRIRRGEARVVAGTRSAVFAPVGDLALIIV